MRPGVDENGWLHLPDEPGYWWFTLGRWHANEGWSAWPRPQIVHVTEIIDGLVLCGSAVLVDKREDLERCVWCARFRPVEFPAPPWYPLPRERKPQYAEGGVFWPNRPGWALR